MTTRTLISRSLRYYWRTHIGVVLGVAVAATVLVGALAVGDSVRESLRRMALDSLGETHLAMVPHERTYHVDLVGRMQGKLEAPIAPVMLLPGTASHDATKERAGRVQVLGVDQRFLSLFPGGDGSLPVAADLAEDRVTLNRSLAVRIGAKVGDTVLLRVSKPSLLPRDAPLTRNDVSDISVALRVRVDRIVSDAAGDLSGGRFSLESSQVSPLNAFVNLEWLQKQVQLPHRANLMLVGSSKQSGLSAESADAALKELFQLSDIGIDVRQVPDQPWVELRTDRAFIEDTLMLAGYRAGKELGVTPMGVLTYMVNEITAMKFDGEKVQPTGHAVPYSMVSAFGTIGPRDGNEWPPKDWPESIHPLLRELHDHDLVMNDWLANQLGIEQETPQRIVFTYFVQGPGGDLVEATSLSRVPLQLLRIVPIAGAAADRTLLPEFPDMPAPGTTFSQWKPSFKMTRRIRPVDDEYWKQHAGTPKAFFGLGLAQKMFGNRFGSLTAVRFPMGQAANNNAVTVESVRRELQRQVSPAAIGLSFVPVRQQALTASSSGFDFAQLFLGFSFFLIVAALLLTGLLFVFAIEQRSAEVGTLLAVGFKPAKVRRLLLGEGLVLAVIGAAIGTACGLAYTQALLTGLTTIWRDAISTSSLQFHVKPMTIPLGWCASVAVAGMTIAWVLRRQARTPARELLAGADSGLGAVVVGTAGMAPSRGHAGAEQTSQRPRAGRAPLIVGALFILAAIAWLATLGTSQAGRNAGAFFGAGSMLLAGGLSLCLGVLARMASSSRGDGALRLTITKLGLRNAARRRGRSLATIGLLACGSFLVIAIGAFWLDAGADSTDRKSGTGGFALYGESTLPVLADLNTDAGLDKFALERDDLPGVSFVPMRLRDGDDASCLNLNRAQNPRLAGVDWKKLAEREAFTFTARIPPAEPGANGARPGANGVSPWSVLGEAAGDADVIHAVGDQNTVVYGLGKGLGDVLDYTDESGRPLKVKIAALTSNSILQGTLFIDEEQFKRRFPSVSGHRLFLIDLPLNRLGDPGCLSPFDASKSAKASELRAEINGELIEETRRKLAAAMGDVGMELTPTVERLAAFNAVQNTYLGIFQALGGLGLVLGSVGLGIVVMRNVLERRSELALLAAIGFAAKKQRWLVISEHWFLLAAGLLCGVVAAAIAVLPAVMSPGAKVPYTLLVSILAGVVVSGGAWTWLASRLALRGRLLDSLRGE